MKNRHWPIPNVINLGYHSVHVKFLSKKEMADEVDWDPTEGLELAVGCWDSEAETIYIAKWIPKLKQRWVLLHEMGHACIDLRDYYSSIF